ncbi:MAG TPA: hypothetical protein VF162_11310 [Streptosporangiaceae bacterium]
MASKALPVTTSALSIPSRFCGPSDSGNGGYVCGRVAAYAGAPATVTLRKPPPLDTMLAVERDGDGAVRVRDSAALIADGQAASDAPSLEIPGQVSAAQASAAAGRSRYFQNPLFPDCFVCGPARQPGDGLRIFPGQVAGKALWAAPWTPHSSVAGAAGRVRAEIVWAALDCPSGIAAADAAGLDTAILLGRMTVRLAARPEAGQPCRVIAWPAGRDGRKLTAFSALLGPGDEVLATARAVWLTVSRLPSGGTS